MFHALALVKIKNGGAKQFLKSFFEIAFIDSYFAAQFLNGKRLSNVLK